ncbi:MAG: hypothetical protein I8H71_02560 [Xanthomonadaceae bacterium]|nr:hypothetical protein [Xanthomonadaceae bacterium]
MLYRAIYPGLARHLAALLLTTGAALPVYSYESDVHYGLTLWLAQKAGYPDWQARALATGNYRVDSGLMSSLTLLPEYACFGKDPAVAREIQERHYPSKSSVPADAQDRVVEPGSSAAREALTKTLKAAEGKEEAYLGLFGAALHPLQDSWAHSGVPAAAAFGSIACDPKLAAVPSGRESGGPHGADLTYLSPMAAVAMAKATYDTLTAFPPIKGEQRKAQEWTSLEPVVRAFAQARTKTAKREWFLKQGIPDTDFLEGTTLADGQNPGTLHFDGRQLPTLENAGSMQHGVPKEAREFFDALIARWMGKEPVESIVGSSPGSVQMIARLKIWKLRDHGTAARLAHLARPYSAAEIAQINALSKDPKSSVAEPPQKAFFPLVTGGVNPSPLLPYILHILPREGTSALRAIAVARLKHAPRDTIGLVAEKSGSGWALVDVMSVVDQ